MEIVQPGGVGSGSGGISTVTDGITTVTSATMLTFSGATVSDGGGGDAIVTVVGTVDGSGTANEITYWVDSNTISSLTTATYPSLTELSYVKGVTSALQTQLNAKQATLVSGTNIKTINSTSLLGSGDIAISASPAGSDKQFQWNSSSSFAGSGNLTQETNQILVTATDTAVVPFAIKGIGSQTAHFQDWISSAGSVKAYVDKDGGVHPGDPIFGGTGNSLCYVGATDNNLYFTSGSYTFRFDTTGELSGGINKFGWGSAGIYSGDTFIYRDAANELGMRNSTTAQTFRVYNTFTSSTNYERGVMQWDTNVLEIGTEKGSGGGTARGLALQTDATTRVSISATGLITIADVLDIAVGSTTGTKIGTATTQKLGFWNTTPIVQPTTAVAAATFVANTSLIANDTATFDGYTIGQVVKALRNAGLLA